jgi:hypothetical protein
MLESDVGILKMAKGGLRNLIPISLMIMRPNERACLVRIATHMKAYRNKVSMKKL